MTSVNTTREPNGRDNVSLRFWHYFQDEPRSSLFSGAPRGVRLGRRRVLAAWRILARRIGDDGGAPGIVQRQPPLDPVAGELEAAGGVLLKVLHHALA